MSLMDRIKKDMFAAMKARDARRKNALSFLSAELKREAIDRKLETLEDLDSLTVLQKQLKMRQESLKSAEDADRADLVEENLFEIDVIQEYLPKAPTDAETEALARDIIAELGASSMRDMGRVMAEAAEREPMVDKGKLSGHVKKALQG